MTASLAFVRDEDGRRAAFGDNDYFQNGPSVFIATLPSSSFRAAARLVFCTSP
jgi:hypothetical protein